MPSRRHVSMRSTSLLFLVVKSVVDSPCCRHPRRESPRPPSHACGAPACGWSRQHEGPWLFLRVQGAGGTLPHVGAKRLLRQRAAALSPASRSLLVLPECRGAEPSAAPSQGLPPAKTSSAEPIFRFAGEPTRRGRHGGSIKGAPFQGSSLLGLRPRRLILVPFLSGCGNGWVHRLS